MKPPRGGKGEAIIGSTFLATEILGEDNRKLLT